jgi:hypothetical protein
LFFEIFLNRMSGYAFQFRLIYAQSNLQKISQPKQGEAMSYLNARRFCSLATVLLGLQCYAEGISGTGGTETPQSGPPVDPLPTGCEFIGGRNRDTGAGPHKVSQGPPGSYANAVAEVPIGRMRIVRFLYLFNGLKKFVPTDFTGDFKISSTEVTVFEGSSTDKRKASVVKFTDGTGKVMLPVTAVLEGPKAFQNLWAIQLKSTGVQIDPPKPVQPWTITILCRMPVTVTEPALPTLTR